jgi:hypothetical protein
LDGKDHLGEPVTGKQRNSLVEFWTQLPDGSPNYIHPQDRSVLEKSDLLSKVSNFDEFVRAGWSDHGENRKLHDHCLPTPYCGDLDNAHVILLLLNPGLSYTNYALEQPGSAIFHQEIGCRKQDFIDKDFPFHWLNPKNCGHEGFIWWEKKLRKTIQQIAVARFEGNYFESLKRVSQTVAAIELIPYHSKSSPSLEKVKELPSVKAARKFVIEKIQSKSDQVIIVLRSQKHWNLESFCSEKPNKVKVCKFISSQSISLGPNSTAGEEIKKAFV